MAARTTPRRLDRQRIVAAALDVLDREGLDGLTMRALGRELGVDPMAVYHYLPSKEALLDAIVEAVWAELRLPAESDVWQDEVLELARAVRDLLRAHPNALPIVATRQNLSAPGLDAAERGIAVLRRAGRGPSEALEILSAAFSFLIGHALAEVGRPPLGVGDVDPATLVEVLEDASTRYPNLLAAVRATDLEDLDTVWDTGIAALVAGIEARTRLRRRSRATPDP